MQKILYKIAFIWNFILIYLASKNIIALKTLHKITWVINKNKK